MFKKLFCLSLLIFTLGVLSCASIATRPDKLGIEPLNFSARPVESWQLENGLQVFFLFDDELPHVKGTLYFPGGSLYEPGHLAGLASATGSQMRDGAIRGVTPDQFDDQLANLAATIETSFGEEFGTAAFYSLSEDFSEVFKLFSRVVLEPGFDEKRFSLWKKLSLEGIRRRRDDPSTMASMAFSNVLYGQDSPFSTKPDFASITKLSSADLRRFHQSFVRPEKAILAIAGNISRSDLEIALSKNFASWKSPTEPMATLAENTHQAKPGIYVLERDFDQATVIIGHQGPPRLSDDMYSILLFNQVFGAGGFGSLLFSEIRTKLGLAYDVWGGFVGATNTGVFQVSLGTRVDQAPKAISSIYQLIERSRAELPDSITFSESLSKIERSFVFRFAEVDALVTRQALLSLLNFPKNYDADYIKNLRAVRLEDVREVAKKRINSSELITVVVGRVSAEQIKEQFGTSYKVYRLEFDTNAKVVGEIG